MHHAHRVSIRGTFASGTATKFKGLKEASAYILVGIACSLHSTYALLPLLLWRLILNKQLLSKGKGGKYLGGTVSGSSGNL